MAPWKLRVAAVAGLAVLLLLLWTWAGSYSLVLRARQGKLVLVLPTAATADVIGKDDPSRSFIEQERRRATRSWDALGVGYFSSPRFAMVVEVPIWPIVLLAAGASAVPLLLLRRQRQRALHRLCAKCGYDLRESDGRCPECGTAALAKPAEGRDA